jgi:hypothetical protein
VTNLLITYSSSYRTSGYEVNVEEIFLLLKSFNLSISKEEHKEYLAWPHKEPMPGETPKCIEWYKSVLKCKEVAKLKMAGHV